MTDSIPHVLLLEPYYGGSHKAFLKGLQQHLPFTFSLVSLPARKWKMRMQLAAPWMADETIKLVEKGERYDAILCSTFIDLATLKALLVQKGIVVPIAVYFHENQFAYPNQLNDSSMYQFTAINFTSALAADTIAFNSEYNRETFLEGAAGFMNKAVDMDIRHKVEEIKKKSVVLYPGIDFTGFDEVENRKENKVPVIVWNHRWEHDKDPDTFFKTMMQLSGEGRDFRLIVLGQHFQRCPEIFIEAERALEKHILHFRYAQDRTEYIRLLHQADIVVSTAIHEFFGMAVLEAVRCGCRPLVPDRLSYRELFPKEYRYPECGFAKAISRLLDNAARLDRAESGKLSDRFSWDTVAGKYEKWLLSLL